MFSPSSMLPATIGPVTGEWSCNRPNSRERHKASIFTRLPIGHAHLEESGNTAPAPYMQRPIEPSEQT